MTVVKLLLDGRLTPTTGVIGFIEASLARCVDAVERYVATHLDIALDGVERRPVTGDLEDVLGALHPLHEGATADRYLLVPTRGEWTAFFDNAADGGDPRPLTGMLPDQLACRTASVYAVPGKGSTLRIAGFTLAAPGHAGMLDAVRVLVVDRRAGSPQVQMYGDPLPGEPNDPADLDLESIDRVLRGLGIHAFDARFYLPEGTEGLLLSAAQ